MPAFLCTGCGLQYPISEEPPPICILCRDERRAIPRERHSWTSQQAIRDTHFTVFRRIGPGIMGIGTQPSFGLGHRALLVRTPEGNVLWDCPSFIDEATRILITALGGVAAIALSTPLSYGAATEWSHVLGSPPIYLHAADRRFVTRPDPVLTVWEDEAVEILPGITLLRCGGHFPGAALLHWAQGAEGQGAVLAGSSLHITPGGLLRFMRSYETHIPLDPLSIRHIQEVLEPWPFDALYGGWWDQVIPHDARLALSLSAERMIEALSNPPAY